MPTYDELVKARDFMDSYCNAPVDVARQEFIDACIKVMERYAEALKNFADR